MSRFSLLIIGSLSICLFFTAPAAALVEIGQLGKAPLTIEDVYQREGTSFIAIDEVLLALELDGEWDSVEHVYRIRTPHGWAVISPGSQFLRLGDNFVPIANRPQFIDGKLRVSETFIQQQLAPLLTSPIYYRNHNPSEVVPAEDPLDRLFAFLLRKKDPVGDHAQRIVAIDPGHGGQDAGSLGLQGSKEKTLTLAVGQRLEKLLKMHQDAPVVMTRNDDYAVDASRRLEIVGEASADALISLHAQAFFNAEPQGIMLYVQPQSERDVPEGLMDENASLLLAGELQKALRTAGFSVHAIQELPVLPLGRGDLPRIMIEIGNMGNPTELANLQDAARQQDLARALFDGLQTYFRTHQETIHEYQP
jgi:N-acetylmuramoyl-L-alanine amidase